MIGKNGAVLKEFICWDGLKGRVRFAETGLRGFILVDQFVRMAHDPSTAAHDRALIVQAKYAPGAPDEIRALDLSKRLTDAALGR